MLRPVTSIKIGENEFDFVTEASFVSSWKDFTDTGEMKLPHKFKKDNKVIFVGEDNLFKKGDSVSVLAGYFPTKQSVFNGYLSSIKPSIPVEMKFEDAAFLLKQTNLTLSFESVTLKELLTACLSKAKEKATGYVLEGLNKIQVEAIDAKLGVFRITNVNITQVLEELQKTYALRSYFRDHILYVGLAYYGSGKTSSFEFEGKGINTIIEHDLEYIKEDDLSFKVKAVSMLEDNTKIEAEVGDPNGEQRTITKYNLTLEELKKAATREIEKLRYEGFRGSFKTFLYPVMYHGDSVEIIDPKTPEKNGVYLVESVEIEIGINGYFQTIKLGVKI
jgi:hypothetical protein